MAWFDITVSGGSATGIALNRQSAAFPVNLTNQAVSQASDGLESWAYQLWNKLAINGEIDAMPGTSYARPSTGHAYSSVPTATPGDISLVWLGGNDVGGIDCGDGNAADGATVADLTSAQLATACSGMYSALISKGYRVIVVKAAYNDFDLIVPQERWVTACDLVNAAIASAMASNSLTEIWDVPTSNLSDGLHPSQAGHDLIKEGVYPRMVAVSGSFPDGVVTTQVLAGAGSVSAPAYSFSTDPDTGIYNTTNALYFGTAGTERVNLSALGLGMSVPLIMGNQTLSGPLDPTGGTHVGDRDYNDARYVQGAAADFVAVAGDTMTGDLDMNNAGFVINPKDPTGATHVGDRAYNDLRYALIAHNQSASTITSGTLAVARGGTGVTTSTGTGSTVRSASPTFTGTVGAATVTATGVVTGAGVVSTSTIGAVTIPVAAGGVHLTEGALGIISKASSDARLKDNVENLGSALGTLNAIRPVSFTWKAHGGRDVGFIAQELREVLPEAAPYNEEKDEYYYRDTPIVSVLVKAVQELVEEVTELKTELKALKEYK